MSDVELKGVFSAVPFARLTGLLARRQATGVVEITDAIGESRAFFLNGVPQGAKLARLFNPIGRLLVECGCLSEDQLEVALKEHNRTDQLLGQVLLGMSLISQDTLQSVMALQSRQNFLHLFSMESGSFQFKEGLVHLTDFTPGPQSALACIYEGLAAHAPAEKLTGFCSRIPFVAVRTGVVPSGAEELPPAERLALRLLREPRLTGELARCLPLPPTRIAALLYALNELGALEIAHPAQWQRSS